MGENGVLFNKDKTLIVSYPAGKTEMKFTIPSTVNTLGINSFSGNLFLKEVTMDISVEKIDSDVFTGCSNTRKCTYHRR